MTQKQFEQKQLQISDKQLIELSETAVIELALTGGRSFTMSVPPEITDTDMMLCELIRRYREAIQENCPACYGAGVVPGEINGCYHCKGTGITILT